eukprot:COSAG02_NODE_921_length_15917_cov_4.428057_12_plen_418_part_00
MPNRPKGSRSEFGSLEFTAWFTFTVPYRYSTGTVVTSADLLSPGTCRIVVHSFVSQPARVPHGCDGAHLCLLVACGEYKSSAAMLRPPNLNVEPAAVPGAAGEEADELYDLFKSEVAASPRRSLPAESSIFAKLASEDSFTGRARFGTAVERDEAVHHLAQITRRSAADQPTSPRWNSPKSSAAASCTIDHSIPPKAPRMQSATLSRLAQPKRRYQSRQACGSPTRARAGSPTRPHSRAAAAAQQVILKESEQEVEVEVDGKVFLVDVKSRLVFQILPELESDEEVGTWDVRQQLITFRRSSPSPRKHQAKAESGSSIVERLLQYQAEKERRLEDMRKKEQQKRLAEELAECRPSPRTTSGIASRGGNGDADGVALAERCQAWAAQRDAKLEAARQRQEQHESQLWSKPEPANGPGA